MKKTMMLSLLGLCSLTGLGQEYKANWADLDRYPQAEWINDLKFGMYWHWNYNSLAGVNGWYGRRMYEEGSHTYKSHIKKYGDPAKFGYKDFEPLFKAEKFSAKEWVDDAEKIGAKFVVGMAVHHDGFDMYDSSFTEWNSVDKLPHIDIMGELEKEARKRGMKFGATSHLAWNWFYFSSFMYPDKYDAKLAPDLYNIHDPKGAPSDEFVEEWYNRTTELIDKYKLDFLWFDFGTMDKQFNQHHTAKLTAFYYNKAQEWGKAVALASKVGFNNKKSQVKDLEQGKYGYIRYPQWMSDCTFNDGWFFMGNENEQSEKISGKYWTHQLIDIVSKNGTLLLNVGPRADGSWPDKFKNELYQMGDWLKLNGEAIYYTKPWIRYGEGPTHDGDASHYKLGRTLTGEDVRFTTKDGVLYAIVGGWNSDTLKIKSLAKDEIAKLKIKKISMLNSKEKIKWKSGKDALEIEFPKNKFESFAYVFKIEGANMTPKIENEYYKLVLKSIKNINNLAKIKLTLKDANKPLVLTEVSVNAGDGNSLINQKIAINASSLVDDSSLSALSDGNQSANPRYSKQVITKKEKSPYLEITSDKFQKLSRMGFFSTKQGMQDLLEYGVVEFFDKDGNLLSQTGLVEEVL